MSYDYIKRTYPVSPRVGQRVKHLEIGQYGNVVRENKSQSHYVMVLFDAHKYPLPCHPTALEYGEKL